jgi:hypothetical protein
MGRALGKLFTFACIVAFMVWVVRVTSHDPPGSVRSGTIDLSERGSTATIQPDGPGRFLITIVPISAGPFLLGAPIPDPELRLRITRAGSSITVGREQMTASALYDDRFTIMLWNGSYGAWFEGAAPVEVRVETPSRAYGKSMSHLLRYADGGDGVER